MIGLVIKSNGFVCIVELGDIAAHLDAALGADGHVNLTGQGKMSWEMSVSINSEKPDDELLDIIRAALRERGVPPDTRLCVPDESVDPPRILEFTVG